MHTSPSNERNVGEDLPDPRLNPMINPCLAKNLGRWAKVYYTTPPEKREQAVLDLLRELESAQRSDEEVEPPRRDDKEKEEESATQEALLDPSCGDSSAGQRHFCGMCGSPLKADRSGDAERQRSSLAPLPALLPTKGGPGEQRAIVEARSAHIRMVGERRPSRKGVAFVLILSASVGAWGWWRMRVDHAAPQTASKTGSIQQRTSGQSRPNAEFRDLEAGRVSPAQPRREPAKRPSKPAAGKPIDCGGNHLENCSGVDLYRKTMKLANGIDALFIDYDKRVTRLLLDAKAQRNESVEQKENRSRQANHSAQLWERLQLGSFASGEKDDALKYRAEIRRRVSVPKSGGRPLVATYENPQSCLELHYIAEDLRRLAATLPRGEIGSPASIRRAATYSLSH
jgi:hypothetical protein